MSGITVDAVERGASVNIANKKMSAPDIGNIIFDFKLSSKTDEMEQEQVGFWFRPVEARIKSISNVGILTIKFSHDLAFPDDFKELIESKIEDDILPPIQIDAQFNYDIESEQIMTWNTKSFTKDSIELELEFTSPEAVSQGDDPDKLFILLNLQNFTARNG